MKRYFLIALSILVFEHSFSQDGGSGLKWYDWDEGYALAQKSEKILLVDLITFKCPYCVKMEKETYTDPEIIKILQKDFICVKVNPKREGIVYKVDDKSLNGTELSNFLTSNSMYAEDPKIAFPTTVFIMPFNKQIFVEPGFQEPKVFKYMLFNCVKAKERLEKRLKK